jgi:pimeloyl-ACP methyl ester carboxylesterase
MKRRTLLILVAAIGIVLIATVPFLVGGKNKAKSTADPIVLVHGYALVTGCPGGDVGAYWSGLTTSFISAGWANPIVPVSFYQCDTNGTSIDSHGDPKAYFPSGEVTAADGSVAYTKQTDTRHLAYVLAWYIYDTYSAHGQSVDLVGHSMGGLMMRWALQQVAARNAAFPPYLLVSNAVTISSPYLGAIAAVGKLAACAGALQCAQFAAGSPFLAELATNPGPQGRDGTDWSVMGGGPCDDMSAASATAMTGHRITWTKPCYTHAQILFDQSQSLDATAAFANPGQAAVTTDTAPHSLAAVLRALQSTNW